MMKKNNDEFIFNGEYNHNDDKDEDKCVFNGEYNHNDDEFDKNEYYWK